MQAWEYVANDGRKIFNSIYDAKELAMKFVIGLNVLNMGKNIVGSQFFVLAIHWVEQVMWSLFSLLIWL